MGLVKDSQLLQIRLATFDDLPAILAISNWAAANTTANFAIEPETLESWQETWNHTHETYPYFVAEDESIIGFAKASPWKGRCAYAYSAEVTVYVHPDHHRKGIGRSLYEKLIATLKAQGYHTLLGGITQPNEASVKLHESLGFTRVALFEHIGWKFEKWHDVGYWELVVQGGDGEPQPIVGCREAASGKVDY